MKHVWVTCAAFGAFSCVYDVPDLVRSNGGEGAGGTVDPPPPPPGTGDSGPPPAPTMQDADTGVPPTPTKDAGVLSPRCLEPTLVPEVFAADQGTPFNVATHTGEVFWIDVQSPSLKTASEAGGEVRVLRSGLVGPFGLAVDDTHVYWTGAAADAVNRVPRNGTIANPRMRDKQGSPHGLAVDETHIYWASRNHNAVRRIRKADAEDWGIAPEELATNQTSPRLLALDETHVYFSGGDGYVSRVLKNGGPVREIITKDAMALQLQTTGLDKADVTALAVHDTWVYFRAHTVRAEAAMGDAGAMFRVKKSGTDLVQLFPTRPASNSFLQVVDGTFYLPLPSAEGQVWRFSDQGDDLTILNCEPEDFPSGVAVSDAWIYYTSGSTIKRTPNR